MSNKNSDRLSHSRWNCKYHIVFAPKYRRQIINTFMITKLFPNL